LPLAVAIGVPGRGTIYDPADPLGKMFFNILATFAEFEVDLLRLRTRAATGNVCPVDAAVTSTVVTSYKRRGT
jgi:hypothetical protein